MPQKHTKTVQRTAHYYTIGTPSKTVNYFWLVTHGYGQLASQIIHKFDGFDSAKHLIVAPEALNKFYWKRPQVGATWMTSAHRLDEIEDYTSYLKGIYDEFISQLNKDVKIILFGFSQGCQTQFRWILKAQPNFHHFIIWAGLMPDDIDFKPFQNYFKNKQLHWVYGDKDEFLNATLLDWQTNHAKEQGIDFQTTTFHGKHRIDRTVLHELWENKIK